MANPEYIVAVIDGGARGADLLASYAASKRSALLVAAPGNDWMKYKITDKPVEIWNDLKTSDADQIVRRLLRMRTIYSLPILCDVAQDEAVYSDLATKVRQAGMLAVGPSADADVLEASKAETRELLRGVVLQPDFVVCHSAREGFDALTRNPFHQVFVKADGFTRGQGAIPGRTRDEALEAVVKMAQFGEAGRTFVIEELLRNDDGTPGEEGSIHAVCHGRKFKILGAAQDYKLSKAGDEGENCGSKGCNSPTLLMTPDLFGQAEQMYDSTLEVLDKRGTPYSGILNMSVMVVKRQGRDVLYLVEYNARYGDPERQAIGPSLENDAVDLGEAVAQGAIEDIQIKTDGLTRVVTVISARDYPNEQSKKYKAAQEKRIFGIDQVEELIAQGKLPGVDLLGAGVRIKKTPEGGYEYYLNGGRNLNVRGTGKNILEACQRSQGAAAMLIAEENSSDHRPDIGWRDKLRYLQVNS